MNLPKIGDRLKTRYHLDEVLGEGGFAVVFRGTDHDLGRDVAVKVLKPGKEGYDKTREERFLRELRAIARLRSQHTVTLFDYGRTVDGILFMVCEFADGEDLSAYLAGRGKLTEHETTVILTQILESMEEAHQQGLLHRDIKPANIMIRVRRGRISAQLLDFGLAKSLVQEEAPLTAAGKVVGTPRYMAPEQLLGLELTAATDIYSLGLVAYECLVGHRTAPMIMPSKSLRVPRDAASPALRSIINRMLAKNAEARFSSVEEVLVELDQLTLPAVESPPQRVERKSTPEPEPEQTLPDAAPLGEYVRDEMPTIRAIPEATLAAHAETVSDVPVAIPPQDNDSTTQDLSVAEEETDEDFDELQAKKLNSGEVRRARKKVYGPLPKELRRERRARERRERKTKQVVLYAGLAVVTAIVCVLVLTAITKFSDDKPATTPTPNLRPRISSSIDTKAPALDAGCSTPWQQGVIILDSASRKDRDFTTVVPSSDAGERLPLVVFTASGAIPSTVDTGFRELAQEEKFVLVEAPADLGRGVPLDAVVSAKTSLCIDSSAIFMVAVGADATESVTADLYDFTAVATMTGRPMPPPDGVPHLHIHNSGDRRTPHYRGSRDCAIDGLPYINEFTSAWATRNGCGGKLETYGRSECTFVRCVSPFVTCTFDGGSPWENDRCSASPKGSVRHADVIWQFFRDARSPLSELRVR